MSQMMAVNWAALEKLRAVRDALPAALAVGVRRVLVRLGDIIAAEIRTGPPKQRSGRLALSWQVGQADSGVEQGANGAVGFLRSRAKYARIQNEGGVVVPVSAHMLAVPLAAAKTAAGVSRWQSPRQVPDLSLRMSKAGRLLLVRLPDVGRPAKAVALKDARARAPKRGTGRVPPVPPGAVPYYALVDRVEVPASRYLERAKARASGEATAIVREALREALAEA